MNEARIMTDEEIRNLDEGQFVWIQFVTRGLYCLEIIGICKNSDGNVAFMQFDSPNDYIEVDFAKHPFRLWTGQPTEKQMDEVEWK